MIIMIKRGRIKRGCSQKPDLQIGGETGPRHIQNTGRGLLIRPGLIRRWFVFPQRMGYVHTFYTIHMCICICICMYIYIYIYIPQG